MIRVIILIASLLLVSCGNYELKNLPLKNDRIACLGDSLVAGVGSTEGMTYPNQLINRSLNQQMISYRV